MLSLISLGVRDVTRLHNNELCYYHDIKVPIRVLTELGKSSYYLSEFIIVRRIISGV